MVKLEKVVEELKEEIWELDTNNRLIRHGTRIVKKWNQYYTCTLYYNRNRNKSCNHYQEQPGVLWDPRGGGNQSRGCCSRCDQEVCDLCHLDHPGLVVTIEWSALIFNLLAMI